jgi:hypothetical protein
MSGSDIDNAVIATLAADATLLGFCPNGVYWDEAPSGFTKFVIVSLVDSHDEPELGGTAYEELLYAIEARILGEPGQTIHIHEAADRIQALLHDQPLTVPGYDYVSMHRDTEAGARIRKTEVAAPDSNVRWYRRGGYYRVLMAPQT